MVLYLVSLWLCASFMSLQPLLSVSRRSNLLTVIVLVIVGKHLNRSWRSSHRVRLKYPSWLLPFPLHNHFQLLVELLHLVVFVCQTSWTMVMLGGLTEVQKRAAWWKSVYIWWRFWPFHKPTSFILVSGFLPTVPNPVTFVCFCLQNASPSDLCPSYNILPVSFYLIGKVLSPRHTGVVCRRSMYQCKFLLSAL